MPTDTSIEVRLRELRDSDLPVIFEYESDPVAIQMAAFTADDPADRVAFDAHWARIRANAAITIRTILVGDAVAGTIAGFERDGDAEVTYWVGRQFWGKGVATRALAAFLREHPRRPLHARAAKDNVASIRVLEKCGFTVAGYDKGFANARGAEIDEVILMLG